MTYTEIMEESKDQIKKQGFNLDFIYDNDLYRHCMNVAYLSIQLGIAMEIDLHELITLGIGALLHDIGKIEISSSILNKPDKLTDEERLVIESHPVMGYQYLLQYHFPKTVMDIVLYHHEKLDGSGYPAHKTDIPLMVQLVTVADVYEAIRAKRVYRDANAPKAAYAILKKQTGLNKEMIKLMADLVE